VARTVRGVWHKHRSPRAVLQEWRLPGPERRAARAERRAEALMREQRAAALEAERRRHEFLPCD
jgi:hypothetical protein